VAILTFDEILTLIDRVSDSGISLIEIESGGVRLRIEGKAALSAPAPAPSETISSAAPQAEHSAGSAVQAVQGREEPDEDESWHVVTSPIVGTFYRSPNPESEAFVNVGDRVSKGSVLCIIEAMKLFNEIESEMDGVIMKVYPQNGQPVEYGEKLFAIRGS
jgi:acetyl-CoA carboxylase biotin carboxyl carrier protein